MGRTLCKTSLTMPIITKPEGLEYSHTLLKSLLVQNLAVLLLYTHMSA